MPKCALELSNSLEANTNEMVTFETFWDRDKTSEVQNYLSLIL